MKKNSRVFFIITTFVIGLLGTVAYILSQYTLVDFGISVAYFALLALVSGTFLWNLRLWMRITGFTNFLPNYLCHSVCTGVVSLALFYICMHKADYLFMHSSDIDIENYRQQGNYSFQYRSEEHTSELQSRE